MLKLKLQYFGHLMGRTDSLEKPWCWERLRAGGEGGDREWDGWMASPTQQTWAWANSEHSEGQGGLVCCGPWSHKESTRLSDWPTTKVWAGLTQSWRPWEQREGFPPGGGVLLQTETQNPCLFQPSHSALRHQLLLNLLPPGLSRGFQPFQLPQLHGSTFYNMSLSL